MNFLPTENRTYKVFIDFDCTITRKDVGEHMFLRFGDAQEAQNIIKRWINKEIPSTESWVLLCATIKNFDESMFKEFMNQIEIDPDLIEFIEYCERNKIDTYVLSDGLDYYINYILKKFGLERLTVYSNKLTFDENNNLIPIFPYTDEECKVCANCKRNHIINNSSDDDYSIYIGDGYSDTCPAQYVDYIFAKNSLLKFCEKERISYFPFTTFNDVTMRLEQMRNKKRLRKRQQAFLKRKAIYQQG